MGNPVGVCLYLAGGTDDACEALLFGRGNDHAALLLHFGGGEVADRELLPHRRVAVAFFTVAGETLRFVKRRRIGGVGRYAGKSIVHVDTGDVRTWAWGYGNRNVTQGGSAGASAVDPVQPGLRKPIRPGRPVAAAATATPPSPLPRPR